MDRKRKTYVQSTRHLMSLKHGSDSPETSHDPAYECTIVEGREPLLEACSQAMNPFCSCFAPIALSSRLLPIVCTVIPCHASAKRRVCRGRQRDASLSRSLP